MTMLRERGQDQDLIDRVWEAYKDTGFYVRAKDVIKRKQKLVRYVGRYVRHPAIAESRIEGYDGKTVLFRWADEHDVVQHTSMPVNEFMSAVTGHVPEKNFKLVRHYGAYARNLRAKLKTDELSGIEQQEPNPYATQSAPKCPICDKPMELIWYHPSDPPPDLKLGERIADWC